jgi:hypothetical protein
MAYVRQYEVQLDITNQRQLEKFMRDLERFIKDVVSDSMRGGR